jgi:hypothetical protein
MAGATEAQCLLFQEKRKANLNFCGNFGASIPDKDLRHDPAAGLDF